MATTSVSTADQFRQAREKEREKFKECCDKQMAEKGNKYGADELKTYIRKQKEIRKYRELLEFEERERLLESKKQRLRELDVKCKQIAYKKQTAVQLPPFPVPGSHHLHQQQQQQVPQQNYNHNQAKGHREVRETVTSHKFTSHSVTSTTTAKNLPCLNDRDRSSHGHGKPTVKRTKYTNQEVPNPASHGHSHIPSHGHNEGAVVGTEAKRSKSNCKLERQAANFIFKEFENIVRRECKNLLRSRSSHFHHISGESSSSIGSNSKSEINLHYNYRDHHRERDRDNDRDSSHSTNSNSKEKDAKREKRRSKGTVDKAMTVVPEQVQTKYQMARPPSASATTLSTNLQYNLGPNHNHNHNHRTDRGRDRERERDRGVTKVDKNVGTSFLVYENLDNLGAREQRSSDGCSSVDMDVDDNRSQVSDVKPVASSRGFHSLFQSQKSKHQNYKRKPELLTQQLAHPPYAIPRPQSQHPHPRDYHQSKSQSQNQNHQYHRHQQQIPESVKHAAAAKIQAAYKSYKVRSILSEAKLRARAPAESTSSTAIKTSNYSGNGSGATYRNGGGNHEHLNYQNYHKRQHHHLSNSNISHRNNRSISPGMEFSSGDSIQEMSDRTKHKANFYKLSENQGEDQNRNQDQNQNQMQKAQMLSLSRPQPHPEKPYDERSHRHQNANGEHLSHGGSGIPMAKMSPGQGGQGSGAHVPIKSNPNPEDIPGYIPPPAGYGYSPIPRAPSYSPRTLPLLRLRHVDEPFPKQALDNLDTSNHSLLGGQQNQAVCQSPVKLISSISKFQMPYSLQHGHGQDRDRQQVSSSPMAPAPITFIPKPSSHPPSFLLEGKTKKYQQMQSQTQSQSQGQYMQSVQQQEQVQSPQSRYATAGTATGSGSGTGISGGVHMRSHREKAPQSSLAAGATVLDTGFGTGTIPQQSQITLRTLQSQMKKSPSNLHDLPEPVFTTVLQEKMKMLRSSQNQSQILNQNQTHIQTHIQTRTHQQINISSGPVTCTGTGTATTTGPAATSVTMVPEFSKSSPTRRSQMTAVSKATEQIKKKIVEAKQILEDYKLELLRTNSGLSVPQLHGGLGLGPGVEGDITYESDFDIDSQSVSQMLPQDQESLYGHDSEILQSLDPDMELIHTTMKTKKEERERERLEREREREKAAVAAQYIIPRPRLSSSVSTSASASGSTRSRSRSSREKESDQRTKTKLPVPVQGAGSASPTPSEATSTHSEAQQFQSQGQVLSPRSGSIVSPVPSHAQAKSHSKSRSKSESYHSESMSIQTDERDVNIHANVSSRSSISRAKARDVTDEALVPSQRQRKSMSVASTKEEKKVSSSASSGSTTPVPVPARISPPKQDQNQDHGSDTDYEELAPSLSRASSNLPTEDVVYDMDFDTDLQSSMQSKSLTQSRRGSQQQQQQQQQESQVKKQEQQEGRGQRPQDISNASIILDLDLDVTSGKKSDEAPSEQNSLSFSLSLNAQGQQQLPPRQHSISVGPGVEDEDEEVEEEEVEEFDMEENLPSTMSSIAVEEIISASIKLDQEQESQEEDVDESIVEDLASQKSKSLLLSSLSSSHGQSKKKQIPEQSQKQERKPQQIQFPPALAHLQRPEPTSKDTSIFDERDIDTNLSLSMPSVAYDFEDFETDASVSLHHDKAPKQTKETEEVSVAVEAEVQSEPIKDSTIVEEEQVEDPEEISFDVDVETGAEVSTTTNAGVLPDVQQPVGKTAGKKTTETEVEDSFISEIPEDISVSVSNANSTSLSSQKQRRSQLSKSDHVQSQKQKPVAVQQEPEPEEEPSSVSSISEEIPSQTMSELTPTAPKSGDNKATTTAKNVEADVDIDISGKIVGEMDSMLSDASNIIDPDDQDHQLRLVKSPVSEPHSKAQDQSTQKSATTDFSQQANINNVVEETGQSLSHSVREDKEKSQSPVIEKSGADILVVHSPVPLQRPVLVAESDEEISEIAEDLPEELSIESQSRSQSGARSHTPKSTMRHDDRDNEDAKSLEMHSKSDSVKFKASSDTVPSPAPVPATMTMTPTPTTWDAELSGKFPLSVSERSDLPVVSKIDVQGKVPVNNLQVLPLSEPELVPVPVPVPVPAAVPAPAESVPEPQSEPHSKTSEISEDIPKTPEDASISTSEKTQSQSKSGKDKLKTETAATKMELEPEPTPQPELGVETRTNEASTQSDSDSFLASIASQVSEILSKSKSNSISKSKMPSQKEQLFSSKSKNESGNSIHAIPSPKVQVAESGDKSASQLSMPTPMQTQKQTMQSQTQSEVQEDQDNGNLLDLAKTMDTDIIEKIESLIADEVSKQMELEEKEAQSTSSQATEIDGDDSKFSLASYANFHVEDVVYESDFDVDVETDDQEPSQKSQSENDKSGKSKSERSSKSKSKSVSLSKSGQKHSGLLEAVVKNEVELLVKEQRRQEECDGAHALDQITSQEKVGEGDFIRISSANTTSKVEAQTVTKEEGDEKDSGNNNNTNENSASSNLQLKLESENQKEIKFKPKLGVEARVRTILENKETMDGLVTRIVARMLKEVSAARSATFRALTISDSNTELRHPILSKDKEGDVGFDASRKMVQGLDEHEDDGNSVSTHDDLEPEADVDDAEWFEDDLISGANAAEDESLKREAAEIVAEQMRIENEIRALEALQAQVPATLLNLSDVPDKPPPPYSPPSSDSVSLGLRSFAIQYTQKQLQDLIRNQVDRVWGEWSTSHTFPQYDYVDESEAECDFSLKQSSLSGFLDENGKEKVENEPSGGDTTQNRIKKDKESAPVPVPVPVLSTRAFNTLLFDLIKDTIKEILLIEDESSNSIGKDYVDRIRPGSLTIEAQKMRIPKTKEGLFGLIYARVKNLLPYPLLTNDVPVPRRRLTKWTSRPRDLVDEVLAEELIDEDREWTESWPEEILVIDRWAEKFSKRAVREVMGAFNTVFTTSTSV